ncbi:uncharacterized protein LOC129872454 [Solanum dulcamara]|uniref:uncharacterized protein LOC129872454 n=1 Tax=Solanum dulcamara TaxID=45834 RepID=UPI0024850B0E|nr:uncharacterized protein LOC129872454 [Solanum dulcamara]
MTYAEQMEVKLRERSRGFKKTRVDRGGFNPQRSSYDGSGKGKGGQRFVGQCPTNFPPPKFNKDKGNNKMDPRENVGTQDFLACKKCRRTHKEECLAGSNTCFKCSMLGHHARDCKGGHGGRPQG